MASSKEGDAVHPTAPDYERQKRHWLRAVIATCIGMAAPHWLIAGWHLVRYCALLPLDWVHLAIDAVWVPSVFIVLRRLLQRWHK